ncbi:hypothetical protein P280DRAFT_169285 [Massarina eburnea CBS 473.64]|uniref:C2H2-type domain-containing protein n=1 Tax=Massarina eburnea CBS 473.64 TaxID=1395130 RepID=A0A6A6RK11_9PLEO|nr:hypothetical protein P280DRAFT_169285 [Massarina eburnea CBS 473.64]
MRATDSFHNLPPFLSSSGPSNSSPPANLESSNQRPRRDGNSTGNDVNPSKRFACPYFKHNPQRYHDQGPCAGPGFASIARVKEHLYRCDLFLFRCEDCFQYFEDEKILQKHSCSLVGNPVRQEDLMDGLDRNQLQQVKARGRMFGAKKNEEEKWKIIYTIIFPESHTNLLPSPYYDDQEDSLLEERDDTPPKRMELAEYKA